MAIVSSTYTAETQIDGEIHVHEQHTDHTGFVHDQFWRAPAGTTEAELQLTLQLRADQLGAEIDMRERAEAEAHSFAVALTPYQFLSRFTAAERIAIRAAAASDSVIDDFLQMLDKAQGVYVNNATTVAGLGYLVSAGLLTQSRADEVLA